MKKLVSRILLLCLVLTAVASLIPTAAKAAPAAGTSNLVVTSYIIANENDKAVGSVSKGQVVNVLLTLKNTDMKTSAVADAKNLDVSKLVDSFSGGTITKEIRSSGDDPLEFTVKLTKMTYTGSGKNLKIMVGYKGTSLPYDTVETAISELKEYEPPKDEPTYTPDTIPAPLVVVSRGNLLAPMQPGSDASVTISFKNVGTTPMRSPDASFTPSDALTINGGTGSFVLSDIGVGQTVSLTISIHAADTISTASQSLSVDLKFNYFNGTSTSQGSASDKVNIPAVVKGKDSIPQPIVIVTRSPISKPISAGEIIDVTVSFKNMGKTVLVSPVASFSTSESLVLLNDTSTFVLSDLAPGKSISATVKVKANKEISSTTQSVSVDLKYSYDSGDAMAQGTASDKVNIPANATSATQTDSPVPNLIISKFSYGDETVAAGAKFVLSFKISNTSTKTAVENIVATIDSGDSFAMDGSTNTFFYKRLAAGGEQPQDIPMMVLPAAKTGGHPVDITFKYEYVDNNKRSSATASVKLSIPVFQPDRFQINAPSLPENPIVGEELSLSLAYVNKGKSEVSNVEASIEGDIPTLLKTQNLGNFESGKSGNIGFSVTPDKAGTISFTLKVSYEDANQQTKTREFPVKLNVQEAPPPASEGDVPADGEGGGGFPKWIIVVGIILLLGGGTAFVIIKKKKSKLAAGSGSQSDWDSWDEDELADAPKFDEYEPSNDPGGDETKEE